MTLEKGGRKMAVINVNNSQAKKKLAVSRSEYIKDHIYLKCRER